MEQPEPPETRPEPEPEATEDTLRRLEARLDRASAAAERLLSEAAARIGGAAAGGDPAPAGGDPAPAGPAGETSSRGPTPNDQPPPAGWQIPGEDGDGQRRDLDLLVGFVQSLRDLIPADLQRRLTEALRELLLAVRALIDWYLDRMERRRSEPADVQDIPIQ